MEHHLGDKINIPKSSNDIYHLYYYRNQKHVLTSITYTTTYFAGEDVRVT